MMTAKEVWEKYKHLDAAFSDRDLLPDSFWGSIIFDLWGSIKNSLIEEEKSRLVGDRHKVNNCGQIE
jgi:hypothetical protein